MNPKAAIVNGHVIKIDMEMASDRFVAFVRGRSNPRECMVVMYIRARNRVYDRHHIMRMDVILSYEVTMHRIRRYHHSLFLCYFLVGSTKCSRTYSASTTSISLFLLSMILGLSAKSSELGTFGQKLSWAMYVEPSFECAMSNLPAS